MLKTASLPSKWWGRAMITAAYLKNRTLTRVNKSNKTPYELFHGQKPNLSNLRTFGCQAYVYNDDPNKGKLDGRATKGVFLGYGMKTKGYIMYIPEENKLKLSRNVKFLETSNHIEREKPQQYSIPIEINELEPDIMPEKKKEPDRPNIIEELEEFEEQPQPLRINAPPAREKRVSKPNKDPMYYYRNDKNYRMTAAVENCLAIDVIKGGKITKQTEVPRNYEEASKVTNWMKAMQDEYDALIKNNTWTLTTMPEDRTAIGSKWTFRIKYNSDGTIAKYKARLVAKGYTQQEGIDFNETFAPVAKFTTIRAMLALTALKGYRETQMDVNTAYLHADVEEELYMEQPDGFQIKGENGENLVCKLNKSIYGLKQAGRNWNKTLDNWLKDNKMIQSQTDPCLYVYENGDSQDFLALAIYVDDMFCIDNNQQLRDKLLEELNKRFKMVDLGRVNWILGMKVTRTTEGSIRIDQEKYVNDILEKYGMENCKTVKTPIEAKRNASDTKFEHKSLYLSLVGSLIYLSTVTRPDISYAVGKAAQKMSNPSVSDWILAKRILRYLKEDKQLGPHYKSNGNIELYGYVDSDWGGDEETRKSTTGYVFILGGAAISWISKQQPTVALSSTEAEYMAASVATQEAIFLRMLTKDLKLPQIKPTIIYQDNQGAIKMANNPFNNQRTKHIDIRHHFVREKVTNKEIKLEYMPTEKMIADSLTKPVSSDIIKRSLPIMLGASSTKSEGECCNAAFGNIN
jgi:hypothetical protein